MPTELIKVDFYKEMFPKSRY